VKLGIVDGTVNATKCIGILLIAEVRGAVSYSSIPEDLHVSVLFKG